MEDQQYEQALRTYLKQLDPHIKNENYVIYYDKEAITGIGRAYYHMNKYPAAQKVFERVLEKDPFYGKARFYLGLTQEQMALEDDALATYRNFPKLSDNDPYKQLMIGRLEHLIRRKATRNVISHIESEDQLQIQDYPENSVCVLYFISQSEDPKWRPLQKGLAEMLSTDLAVSPELTVVERLRLNMLMQELKMNPAGVSSEENAPRMGKLLGARTLIKGSYLITPELKMTLDAGIYQAVRPDFPMPASFDGVLAKLFQMEKQLVLQIFDYFGISLTEQQREKVLKTPTVNMEAFQLYCLGLDALDRNDYENAQTLFTGALRLDPSFTEAKDRLVSKKAWELTHKQNLTRIEADVREYIASIPRGGPEMMIKPKEGLVSAWKRLQHTNLFQNNGFLPGKDSRDGFAEANEKGASIIPERLGVPVLPGR